VGLIVLVGSFTFLIVPEDNFVPLPRSGVMPPLHLQPISGPPTVVLDPGHGGIDDGTKYFGLAEKDMTLDVALRLERLLTQRQVDVVLTRREDVYVSLPERAEIANKIWESNSNVIFVSIHFNQSSVESVDGIETYYADQKIPPPTDWSWIGFFNRPDAGELDLGQGLAADVQSALAARMGLTNRGIKSRSLYVTRHTRMPAILVEGGFLSNKVENEMLHQDGYRDRLVQGLAAGILTYTARMHPGTPPGLTADLRR
jgi:N-acetylmuramoyl-L-alanine amidase